MALTRARVVAGDEGLTAAVNEEIMAILANGGDQAKVFAEARKMRALIEQEKPPKDIWDIKLIPGGLIDLEFIAQVAVLTGNCTAPGRPTATADVLAHLAPGFADPETGRELVTAHGLYTVLTQVVRLCLEGSFDAKDAPPGLVDILARRIDVPDLGVLEAHVKDTAQEVRKRFTALLRASR